MDDIGVSNDDMSISFSLRRPSRAERAVDDPIREMEGMLVDEYGRCDICFISFLHWLPVLNFYWSYLYTQFIYPY